MVDGVMSQLLSKVGIYCHYLPLKEVILDVYLWCVSGQSSYYAINRAGRRRIVRFRG